MSYNSIRGHDRIIDFLKRAVKSGRTAHAYIFLGPSGIGKVSIAVNFAKALNCLSESGEAPCDICASCRKIDSSGHPDVRVIGRNTGLTAIGIDEVRELTRDISLKPYEARKKAYIVDGADKMTDQAQSAILKTLEEPTPDTVLILIAENAQKMLPTIVSRAQAVNFSAMKNSEVADILAREHGVDMARAHVLAGISSGRLGEALKLNGDDNFFDRRRRVLDAMLEGKYFDFFEEGKVARSVIEADLDIMLAWFRDILVTKVGDLGRTALVNIDYRETIAREASRLDFEYLDRAISEIISAKTSIEFNANAKLAMGVLGMEIGAE